jgi:hypothetical protein
MEMLRGSAQAAAQRAAEAEAQLTASQEKLSALAAGYEECLHLHHANTESLVQQHSTRVSALEAKLLELQTQLQAARLAHAVEAEKLQALEGMQLTVAAQQGELRAMREQHSAALSETQAQVCAEWLLADVLAEERNSIAQEALLSVSSPSEPLAVLQAICDRVPASASEGGLWT